MIAARRRAARRRAGRFVVIGALAGFAGTTLALRRGRTYRSVPTAATPAVAVPAVVAVAGPGVAAVAVAVPDAVVGSGVVVRRPSGDEPLLVPAPTSGRRVAGRSAPRRLVLLAMALCVVGGVVATAAWAYWGGLATAGGYGSATAASITQQLAPAAVVGGGQSVAVSWQAGTMTGGQAVTGYRIRRYDAATSTSQVVGAGCSGTRVGLTCTESGVPVGGWKYSVTPLIGTNWQGPESPAGTQVNVAESVLTLAKATFGAPLPSSTTGTLTGFGANQSLSYRLDAGTTLAGSPATSNVSGGATITSLTIPAGTSEGPHTVYAIGGGGYLASFNILVDLTAPTATAQLSPVANGAGWNRSAPVLVTLTGADPSGSGVTQIRYTLDGTDPTISGVTYTGAISVSSTTTVRYYAIDAGGNASTLQSKLVAIDLVAPVNALAVSTVSGSVVRSGNTVYYRGAVSGSFTLLNTLTDAGGSGAAASATANLAGTATGWSHTSSTVSTPTGGPYQSAVFSWIAGTTTSPTVTVTGTDVAGNTVSTMLTFVNDAGGPTGGSVDAIGLVGTGSRYAASTTLNIALAKGTDVSGVAASGAQLSRATAALTSAGTADGACGTYSGYALITGGTDPVSPKADVVTDQACYRYQYLVSDSLGNTTTYTSGDIKVDTTAPAAPTLAYSGFSNTYWPGSGSVVYYRSGAATGSFTVTAAATDTKSGIASYGFPALGTNWTSTPGASGVNTYSWSGAPAVPGAKTITATNHAAGTSGTTGFTPLADGAAPDGTGSISYVNGYASAPSISVSFATGADAGSGLAAGSGLLQRATATLTNSTCGTFDGFTTIAANPVSPATVAVTNGNCYMFQYLYSDNVGNQAIYGSASVTKVVEAATAVTLGDDDSGNALFSTTGLVPGSTAEKCIAVTYGGSLDSTVKLYLPAAGYTGTGLGTYLDMTIQEGTTGSFAGGCTGFTPTPGAPVYTGTLANFAATANTYATGFGTFAPPGGPPSSTRVYRLTYTLQANNAAQNLTSSATFTWQARES